MLHLAHVDAAERVAPLLRFRIDVVAHQGAHRVAVLQHVRELQVAQVAHGGVAHVGAQRAARIGVLEEVEDRVADPHLVPHADVHRRALLRIDRRGAEIFLVEPQVDRADVAEEIHEERPPREQLDREMQPRLGQDQTHLAEEDINQRLLLLDDDVKPELAQEKQQGRHRDEAADEDDERGRRHQAQAAGKIHHFFISRMMWEARA
jgi:hypothetical protein